MKLEDMILVVENRKGTETNFILNLTDYMGEALKIWGGYAEDMAGAIGTLYETKRGEKTGVTCMFLQTRASMLRFAGVSRS